MIFKAWCCLIVFHAIFTNQKSLLAETQIYPYRGTNVYLKREPGFENSKIDTKKENKPLIRQKTQG